jgi:hypothetical protein
VVEKEFLVDMKMAKAANYELSQLFFDAAYLGMF